MNYINFTAEKVQVLFPDQPIPKSFDKTKIKNKLKKIINGWPLYISVEPALFAYDILAFKASPFNMQVFCMLNTAL